MKTNKLKSRGASIWAKVSISPSKAHLIQPFLNYRSIKNPQNILFGNMNSKSNKKLTSIFISTNIKTPNKIMNIPTPKKNVFNLKTKFVSPVNVNYNVPKKKMNYFQALGKYPRMNPLGDIDKDGVLNMFDCKPFDRTKDAESKILKKRKKESIIMKLKNEEIQKQADIKKAIYFEKHPKAYEKYKKQFVNPEKIMEAEKIEKKNPEKAKEIIKELAKEKFGSIPIIQINPVSPPLQKRIRTASEVVENIEKSKQSQSRDQIIMQIPPSEKPKETSKFDSIDAAKNRDEEIKKLNEEIAKNKQTVVKTKNVFKFTKGAVEAIKARPIHETQLEKIKERGKSNLEIEQEKTRRQLGKITERQKERLIHVATRLRGLGGKREHHNPMSVIEPILEEAEEKARQDRLRKPGIFGLAERMKARWEGEVIPPLKLEKTVPIKKVEAIMKGFPMKQRPIESEKTTSSTKVTLIYNPIESYIDTYARANAQKAKKEEKIKKPEEEKNTKKMEAQDYINTSKYNVPPPAVVYPIMEGMSDLVSKKERDEQRKEEAAARRVPFAEKMVEEVEKKARQEKQKEAEREHKENQKIKAEDLLKDKEVERMIEKEKKERVKEIVEESKAMRKAEKEAEILEEVAKKIEPEESSKSAQELIDEA